MVCAGNDTTSGALLAALQNPALGLLSPEQQDLFGRLHRQLNAERKRKATRGDKLDDVDTGKAGRPPHPCVVHVLVSDVRHTACCE